MCSSDISMDGSNFDNLDDQTSDLDLHTPGLISMEHQQINNNLTSTANLMTNIDKLYMMQSSYFQPTMVEQ